MRDDAIVPAVLAFENEVFSLFSSILTCYPFSGRKQSFIAQNASSSACAIGHGNFHMKLIPKDWNHPKHSEREREKEKCSKRQTTYYFLVVQKFSSHSTFRTLLLTNISVFVFSFLHYFGVLHILVFEHFSAPWQDLIWEITRSDPTRNPSTGCSTTELIYLRKVGGENSTNTSTADGTHTHTHTHTHIMEPWLHFNQITSSPDSSSE